MRADIALCVHAPPAVDACKTIAGVDRAGRDPSAVLALESRRDGFLVAEGIRAVDPAEVGVERAHVERQVVGATKHSAEHHVAVRHERARRVGAVGQIAFRRNPLDELHVAHGRRLHRDRAAMS